MINERMEEQASLYALGALPAGEVEQFEAAFHQNPGLAALVRDLTRVSSALAEACVPNHLAAPSLELKDRILNQLGGSESTRTPPHQFISEGQFSFLLQANEGDWKQLPVPGVCLKQLSLNDRYAVILLKMEAGAVLPSHNHTGHEDCYLLQGDIQVAGHSLRAGDFHHAEASSRHGVITTTQGCMALLVVAAQDYLHH